MKRLSHILIIAATALTLAACGTDTPQSAGPLTVPTTVPTTDTTASSPPSTGPGTSSDSTTPDQSSPTTSPPDSTPDEETTSTTITVYFLNSQIEAVATTRTVTTKAVAAAAMEALIEGPTSTEKAAGLVNGIPSDSLVLGVSIANGVATLDMSREFEAGGGSTAILSRLAQVVYTLTEFPTVDRVQLLLDGQHVEYFSGEGVLIGDPLTAAEFHSAVPIGEPYTGSSTSTWSQNALPKVTAGDENAHNVVLVAADDVLNVRAAAGTDGVVIGKLVPGVMVRSTGDTRSVGSSTWIAIETPVGPGWVNSFYLTPSVAGNDFPGDADPADVVAELARRFASGEDITSLISEKGLWVAHHASPIRFPRDEVGGLLDSTTTYRWGSNALGPDSPEITPKTFREAIAQPFVSVYDDPDLLLKVNDVTEGPNGRPAEYVVPTEFVGFPYVTIYDKGDDPQYGGLDWMEWVISLASEGDQIKIVGLTIDQWAP